MKVAFVFHKNPARELNSIDIIRLLSLTSILRTMEFDTDIIAPVTEATYLDKVPIKPIKSLIDEHYDLVKTCYHHSIQYVRHYEGPIVSRIVRVVDEELPERDHKNRNALLRFQEVIAEKSNCVVFNNLENARRWKRFYAHGTQRIALVPTGCPHNIPAPVKNPFTGNLPVALFLGSVASLRMCKMLNEAAELLRGRMQIHHIGAEKLNMYSDDSEISLSSDIVRHGEMSEHAIWDYVRNATLGIALAAGPHEFDNDISKIYTYLRGGLPVLSEERIVNNVLIDQYQYGKIFEYDDTDALCAQALSMLNEPFRGRESTIIHRMVEEHSWNQRAAIYKKLFNELQGAQR